MKLFYPFLVVLLSIILTACETDAVTISAAASTRDALEEIIDVYKEQYPDANIETNYGASGALRIQIEQGAPVDLFLSANVAHFDALVASGHIKTSTALLNNELVLIANDDAIQSIEDLTHANRIALGSLGSVPAGEYGKEALQHYEIWDAVESKMVYAEDVRQVVSYVELGEVDAGIVYHTDAHVSKGVTIVLAFDADSHMPIVYPLGALNDAEATVRFYEFLQSDIALTIFKDYGFLVE